MSGEYIAFIFRAEDGDDQQALPWLTFIGLRGFITQTMEQPVSPLTAFCLR
jgi:hypothetical protein